MTEKLDKPHAVAGNRTAGQVKAVTRVPGGPVIGAGVVVALIVGILIGRSMGPSAAEPGSAPSATERAAGTLEPSGDATPASGSPTPSSRSALNIAGALPLPDAPLPAAAPVIPGLSLVTVATIAASLGFSCDSARVPGVGEGWSDYYWLHCEALSVATNSRSSISADYATLDTVSDVGITIGGTIDASRQIYSVDDRETQRILGPFSALFPGVATAVRGWIGDRSCAGYPSCIQSSRGVSVMYIEGTEPRFFMYPTPAVVTPVPSPTIVGEMPGPEATVPPRAGVIAGLSLHEVVATAASLGLACTSELGGFPDSPTVVYDLVCVGQDSAANAETTFEAYYWTTDAVLQLSVDLRSIVAGLPILDPTAAGRTIPPVAAALGGLKAAQWVQLKMDDPTCGLDVCSRVSGGVQFVAQWGLQGWRSLQIAPPA